MIVVFMIVLLIYYSAIAGINLRVANLINKSTKEFTDKAYPLVANAVANLGAIYIAMNKPSLFKLL